MSQPPQVSRNVPWSLLTYAVTRVGTLLTTLVLARLLSPSEFGLVGLALLGISALNLVTEMGFSNTMLQQTDFDRRREGTMLTTLSLLGIGGAILGILCAPLLAAVFDEPRVEPVVRAMALLVAISGPATFTEALMRRAFAFRRLFMCSLGATVAQLVLAVVLAAAGAGVWSIVAGQAAFRVVLFVSMQVVTPVHVRPAWHPAAAWRALRQSFGFLGQAAVWFIQTNIDFIVVGRLFSTASYGLYTMAYRLAELPLQAVAMPLARVVFPAYTAHRAAGRDPLPTYLRGLRYLALLVLPAGALLSAVAEPLTVTLLGPRWTSMGIVLVLLGAWGPLEALQNHLTWWVNGQGLQKLAAVRSFLILLPSVAAFILAAESGRLELVAAVILSRVVVMYAALLVIAQRHAGVTIRQHAGVLAPSFIGAICAWVAAHLVSQLSSIDAVAAGAGLAAGIVVYVAIVWRLAPSLVVELREYGRGVVRRLHRSAAPTAP